MADIDPQKALAVMHKTGPQYAEAKAQRVHIEESLRSVKAIEMARSGETTAAAQERVAYASEAYRTALDGLRAAVEREETLRWRMLTAQAAIEVWRSMEASGRAMDRVAR
jgi:hypothetical protein